MSGVLDQFGAAGGAMSLDDKYLRREGRVFLTGSQALVRLPIEQAWRDEAAGNSTAGFISGYRGSPLGIYDLALWQAERHLSAGRIRFEPGVNEDLAAAAIWGSQQVPLLDGARHDGVFAIWYGKGPGVDRSVDVIKHANFAGTSRLGGVLALCGDDHAARSSTLAHQSEHALIHCGMPVLNPATIQEYLDLGLLGFALSRFSGCWVGFKCITDTVDGSATVKVGPARGVARLPEDMPSFLADVSIRFEVAALEAERRLFEYKLPAAQMFARANRLDWQTLGAKARVRLGIVTTGKAWLDTMEALGLLGVTPTRAEELGLGVYKVGMVWPLEPHGMSEFAYRCETLLVIEEKRGVVEDQIAAMLFNEPAHLRPLLIGKRDERGAPLVPETGELDSGVVLRVLAARLLNAFPDAELRGHWQAMLDEEARRPSAIAGDLSRAPSFCAGCPHNTSTRVPEGSTAVAGIGCHGMATFLPERRTLPGYHMGGEGAPWIGQAPFVDTPHIFQNLGDGTYFHSGILAIRACVAANVPITYKILLNGAIGMTGGQPIEGEAFSGELTAPRVASQVGSEGVQRIAVVSDDPGKYHDRGAFPPETTFHHRDELDQVQQALREYRGVSVLIYDQSCATERRRLIKRGKLPAREERLYIHAPVCEGCGDCGVQSGCIAIEPLETGLGRKRQINQSVCNTDLSCLKGFCPSFVTVRGGRPRRAETRAIGGGTVLTEPQVPEVTGAYNLVVAGIGGNGVVTVGAVLGTAALMEGRDCTVLDMSGFAQRNGSVMSHVRFKSDSGHAAPARIPAGQADVVIGCDAVVAGARDCAQLMAKGRTRLVVNTTVAPTMHFASDPDLDFGFERFAAALEARTGPDMMHPIAAGDLASRQLGDAIGANMMLVGHAWQLGLVPLRLESIEAAIRLNGAATTMNLAAFELGRRLACAPEAVLDEVRSRPVTDDPEEPGIDGFVAARIADLVAYQDQAFADRYARVVACVREAEARVAPGSDSLAWEVARNAFHLMACKDEYEVARLLASPALDQALASQFEGDFTLAFNLAPPLLSRRDSATGRLRKREFGRWVRPLLGLLARMRWLRGTPFDVFGWHPHRRLERSVACAYLDRMTTLADGLCAENLAISRRIAAAAASIRGYDVVKEANIARHREAMRELEVEYAASAQLQGRETKVTLE